MQNFYAKLMGNPGPGGAAGDGTKKIIKPVQTQSSQEPSTNGPVT